VGKEKDAMIKRIHVLLGSGLLAVLAAGVLMAQDRNGGQNKSEGDEHAADRAAIRKTMRGFAEAFQKGDAAAAVAYLTSGAELIPDEGSPVRGRDAIQKAFAIHFGKKPRPTIKLEVESLHFPSRDTAVEEGDMEVTTERGDTTNNRYEVLYVREEGKWLVAMIRERPGEQAALRDLEWLIGSWSAQSPEVEAQTTYEWFGNKSFIRAQFTVRQKDKTFTAMQMIGTDPKTGALRTWTFEFDGGFGEGTATRDGNKWVFETATALSDGSVLTATNILVRVNSNTFTWQPVNLTVDGEQIADLPPVKVTRVKINK
jgi:uncharacterized protein (TIGR02246 family)